MSLADVIKAAGVLNLAHKYNTLVKGNNFCLLGDSISYNNTGGNPLSWYAEGYWVQANMALGGRMSLLNNGGVDGNTTDQMLARIDADVIAYKPDWCCVLGGINDAYSNGYSAAHTIGVLKQIYQRLYDAGINCVPITIPPVLSSYVYWSKAANTTTLDVNNWIRSYCTGAPGMVPVDAWAVMVDPLDANGHSSAGYTRSLDGIHPSNDGCVQVGALMASQLDSVLPKPLSLCASNVDNYGYDSGNPNILDNGLFQGTAGTLSGGVTGSVADGFVGTITAGSPTVAASLAARSDGVGNDQVLTITPAAAGDTARIQTGLLQARCALGDTLYAEGEVSLSVPGTSAIDYLTLQLLTQTANGGNSIAYGMNFTGTADENYSSGFTLRYRTPNITIDAAGGSVTAIRMDLIAHFSGAAAAHTVKLGRVRIPKVTA